MLTVADLIYKMSDSYPGKIVWLTPQEMALLPKIQLRIKSMNYVGKIVFIQSPDSEFYSGEYVIVEQSPNMLFGVKTGNGYGAHETRGFRYVGDDETKVCTIVRASDDPAYLRRFVASLREFAKGVHSPKRQWIESVYYGAERHADRVEAILNERKGKDEIVSNSVDTMHVFPVKHIRQIVVYLPHG